MALGYDKPLYILAFDHRGSFQKKFFGSTGEANPEESERISDAKAVIFEGFQKAVDDGAPKDNCGILVDEQFGADIVRRAKKEGYLFAMPVERSGQEEFDFQYGDDFGAHIEEFDPNFSKVLVRYNVEGDAGVVWVVLGGGADDAAVEHWLKTGSGVPGYIGFAIGRTIWWDALKAFVDGTTEREAAAAKIAQNYQRMIAVYTGAE